MYRCTRLLPRQYKVLAAAQDNRTDRSSAKPDVVDAAVLDLRAGYQAIIIFIPPASSVVLFA